MDGNESQKNTLCTFMLCAFNDSKKKSWRKIKTLVKIKGDVKAHKTYKIVQKANIDIQL